MTCKAGNLLNTCIIQCFIMLLVVKGCWFRMITKATYHSFWVLMAFYCSEQYATAEESARISADFEMFKSSKHCTLVRLNTS